MGCQLVLLIRHAEPFRPRPGGPDDFHRGLTGRGQVQAERLVGELAGCGPVAVVSSPYLRAVQTVEPAARKLGVLVATDVALREWDSGLEPGPRWAEHYARSWADTGFARPGGESLAQLSERAVRALRAIAAEFDGSAVVVSSHGTFISRALVGFGVAVDWPFSQAMPMPAIYRLRLAVDSVHAAGPGLGLSPDWVSREAAALWRNPARQSRCHSAAAAPLGFKLIRVADCIGELTEPGEIVVQGSHVAALAQPLRRGAMLGTSRGLHSLG